MKKLTTISLFIFWAITTAILIAGLVFYQDSKNSAPANNQAGLNNPAGASAGAGGGVGAAASVVLNSAEILKHNSAGDCWTIINNKVYNVTAYLRAHPGGAGTMTPYCGKEATQAFATKGNRGNSHSSYAASLLAAYLIGDLNQTATRQEIQQTTQKTNSITPPARGRDDDEFDD